MRTMKTQRSWIKHQTSDMKPQALLCIVVNQSNYWLKTSRNEMLLSGVRLYVINQIHWAVLGDHPKMKHIRSASLEWEFILKSSENNRFGSTLLNPNGTSHRIRFWITPYLILSIVSINIQHSLWVQCVTVPEILLGNWILDIYYSEL